MFLHDKIFEKMAATPPPFLFDLVKCENEKSDGEASISSLLPVSSSQVSVRRIQSSLCDVMRSLIMKVLLVRDLTLRSANFKVLAE